MNVKYLVIGGIKLYVFLDDEQGGATAYKMCRDYGYKFYPRVTSIGEYLVNDCYSAYLQKKEKLTETSICTVHKDLFETLNLLDEEVEIKEGFVKTEIPDGREFLDSIKDKKLVFIAGRGIGNRANYERLKNLSYKYGAGMGCSRPVAMNGWESYDNFVGISGNILESDVVICFGVAGASPFIKGIEDCKTVIAINNDKNALIFKNADYAIVDDCMSVISYLEKL